MGGAYIDRHHCRKESMEIGIIGLPQAGKTTLFNALTGLSVDLGYAGGRKGANRGVARVPDPRLDKLSALFNPKSTVHATVNYVDLGGLSGEGRKSSGFPPDVLQALKPCEALLLVLRGFENPELPHPDGPPDPARDLRTAQDEFLLSDLAICEGRIERLEKQLMKAKDKDLAFELETLQLCHAALDQEKPLRSLGLDEHRLRALRSYAFLSLKPLLVVLNVGDEAAADASGLEELRPHAGDGVGLLQVSARIEMELAQMEPDEAAEFLGEYGISEPALDRVLRASFELLALETFFTVGEDECRAWTLHKGSTAPVAAGVIHSDIQKGFIRAEVVPSAELLRLGSFPACKEKGALRLEGREYVVQEGDVVHFRFNV
jgi:GTP-binding protein YchF